MHYGDRQNEPYVVGGKLYYTVRQFADKTNRTVQSVRNLISKGNRIRCLRADMIAGRPLIPAEELTDFPFTLPGNDRTIYHYTKEGKQVEARREHEVQN